MGHDTLAIDGREPRSAPGCTGRHAGLYPSKRCKLASVSGGLGDTSPKLGLMSNAAIMAYEIPACQRGERPTDSKGTREKGKAAGCCDHGEDLITDAGDRQAVRARGKLHPRQIGGGCCNVRLGSGGHAAAL